MLAKVFVLGRPGSGKTTAVRHILELARRRNYQTFRMKDYDILFNMFKEDIKQEKFRPTDYGGFDVLDYSAFDTALKRLEENTWALINRALEIRATSQGGIITIEFARNDYREALHNFSPTFLQDAYFFFVDSGLDTCIQRIHKRVTVPPKPDCHFVSDYIMHAYYNTENWDYIVNEFQQKYDLTKEVMAYRNTGSLQELIEAVSSFAERIFMEELAASRLLATPST